MSVQNSGRIHVVNVKIRIKVSGSIIRIHFLGTMSVSVQKLISIHGILSYNIYLYYM